MEKRIRFTDDASVGLVRNFLDQLWMEIFEALRPGVEVRLTYSIEAVSGEPPDPEGRMRFCAIEECGEFCCGATDFCAKHQDVLPPVDSGCGVKGCTSPAWRASMFCLAHLAELNRYTAPSAEENVLLPCLVPDCPGRGECKCESCRQYYCGNHIRNHRCAEVQSIIREEMADDHWRVKRCSYPMGKPCRGKPSKCPDCDAWACSKHMPAHICTKRIICAYPGCEEEINWGVNCSACGAEGFCPQHADEFFCKEHGLLDFRTLCNISECGVNALKVPCPCCGVAFCREHWQREAHPCEQLQAETAMLTKVPVSPLKARCYWTGHEGECQAAAIDQCGRCLNVVCSEHGSKCPHCLKLFCACHANPVNKKGLPGGHYCTRFAKGLPPQEEDGT